jgi:hypothetical protein
MAIEARLEIIDAVGDLTMGALPRRATALTAANVYSMCAQWARLMRKRTDGVQEREPEQTPQ